MQNIVDFIIEVDELNVLTRLHRCRKEIPLLIKLKQGKRKVQHNPFCVFIFQVTFVFIVEFWQDFIQSYSKTLIAFSFVCGLFC